METKEVARLGEKIYAGIRAEMEANELGRMVVIDVNSGDYEVADDDLTALLRLKERHPDAMTWGERVGYRAPYYLNRTPQQLADYRNTMLKGKGND